MTKTVTNISIRLVLHAWQYLLFNGKKANNVAVLQLLHHLQLLGFDLDVNRSHKVGKHFDSTHVAQALPTHKQ